MGLCFGCQGSETLGISAQQNTSNKSCLKQAADALQMASGSFDLLPLQQGIVAQVTICITKAYWVPSTVGAGVYKCAWVGKNRWQLVILCYPSAKVELSSSRSSPSSSSRLIMLTFAPKVQFLWVLFGPRGRISGGGI